MNKDWLKKKFTVEQAEAENMVTDAQLGQKPVPFGFSNHDWRQLTAQMQPGDALWEYSHVEGPLCGEGGFAIVRNRKVVAQMSTWIS